VARLGSLTSRAGRPSKPMPFRRAKATSEHGQPGVRCSITKERSDVVSLPSERPGRASPTLRTTGLADVRGVSAAQASVSSTFSPLTCDVQMGPLSRRVRFARSRRPSGRGCALSAIYSSTRCACRLKRLLFESSASFAREAARADDVDPARSGQSAARTATLKRRTTSTKGRSRWREEKRPCAPKIGPQRKGSTLSMLKRAS